MRARGGGAEKLAPSNLEYVVVDVLMLLLLEIDGSDVGEGCLAAKISLWRPGGALFLSAGCVAYC